MRPRIRIALVAMAVLAGCGGDGDSPDPEEYGVKKAIRDMTTAIQYGDGATLCSKWFPSTSLPPQLARQLGYPEGEPGTPASWDQSYRECSRDFRRPRAFRDLGRPSRTSLKDAEVRLGPPLSGTGGITRTAKVTGAYDRGRPVTLVEFRGDWKVVIEID